MQTTLNQADSTRKQSRLYAARLLLERVSPGQDPECEPADLHVGDAELDAIFDSVTLRREIATGALDPLGRFDERAIAWETSQPWIDQAAQTLAERAAGSGCRLNDGKRRFRVVITHDVDRTTACEPTSLVRSAMQTLRLRRDPWIALGASLSPGVIARCIERILQFESSQGIGAYYFMLSGPYGLGRHASRCDIRWRSARRIAEMVRQAGMTIGLHGGYRACERNTYRMERERLEDVVGAAVTTHRNHYLRFDPTKMASQLEEAGIRYDFSVGYSTRFGFRAGTARPYPIYDLLNHRPSTVISVPMLYMDAAQGGLSYAEALAQVATILRQAKAVGGCVSLLFHPELFLVYPEHWPFFKEVVAVCKELGADLSGNLADEAT